MKTSVVVALMLDRMRRGRVGKGALWQSALTLCGSFGRRIRNVASDAIEMSYSALVSLLIIANNAVAMPCEPMMDQEQSGHSLGSGVGQSENYIKAQTFVVGIPGWLSTITFFVNGEHGQSVLRVEIRDTVDGIPGEESETLGSVDIPLQQLPQHDWLMVDFSQQNILAQAGDTLAVVLRILPDGSYNSCVWFGELENPYVEGAAFYRGPFWQPDWGEIEDFDLSFKTTMCPFVTATHSWTWGRIKTRYR